MLRLKGRIIFILFFSFFVSSLCCQQGLQAQSIQGVATSTYSKESVCNYQYALFKPSNNQAAINGQYPLIIALHGAGERGNDLQLLRKHGVLKLAERQSDFPFYVLAPQCKKGDFWDAVSLKSLLDEITNQYAIDTTRIYATGYSMGSYGVLDMAVRYPTTFAAIAPICGASERHAFQAHKLADTPCWLFHGLFDIAIAPTKTYKLYLALKRKNATQVKYTLYPFKSHNAWTKAYQRSGLFNWFLQKNKSTIITDIEN